MDSLAIAKNVRKKALILTNRYRASHIGSIFSVVDILSVLYANIVEYKVDNKCKILEDKVILSKGHAGLGQILTMSECGFIKKSLAENYYNYEGIEDSNSSRFNGVEFLCSSLGQGINVAVGLALSQKMKKENNKTYVIVGNGECDEGSIYEAIIFAVQHKLNNLIIIVDDNRFQAMGESDDILKLDLYKIFKAFGACVKKVDGHDHKELCSKLKNRSKSKPLVVVASTIKGKGVKEIENNNKYHYAFLDDQEVKNALKNLEKTSEG